MNSKKFSEAMSELDSRYIDEAIHYKKKARKPIWMKWGVVAACLAVVIAIGSIRIPFHGGMVAIPHNAFYSREDNSAVSRTADAAPMIYVNDTLYKQSASQTSFDEWKDDFVYLGIIESDVTHFQDTHNTEDYLDGIPKENFQANHPIVGAEVYQYGDNIVVGIEGKYWLYEPVRNSTSDKQSGLSNSITLTGTILDNTIDSFVPIILVDVEDNPELSYDKVLFELVGNLISITDAAPANEADRAARAYYENTVFEVISLELKSQTEDEIFFSACVSKGGVIQEPDRTIALRRNNGTWEVVNEGY